MIVGPHADASGVTSAPPTRSDLLHALFMCLVRSSDRTRARFAGKSRIRAARHDIRGALAAFHVERDKCRRRSRGIVVQKFGERPWEHRADSCCREEVSRGAEGGERRRRDRVPMSGETNRLLGLAHEVTQVPDAREMDAIAATGEQVSAALTAMAIQHEGGKARSLLGHQVKISRTARSRKARIKAIEGSKIFSTLQRRTDRRSVAGFQGVDEKGDITTLGRGGSDTTAVAVAAAIGADAWRDLSPTSTASTRPTRACVPRRGRFRASRTKRDAGARVARREGFANSKRGDCDEVRSSGSRSHVVQRVRRDWVTREDKSLEDVVVAGSRTTRARRASRSSAYEDKLGAMADLFGHIAEKNISST